MFESCLLGRQTADWAGEAEGGPQEGRQERREEDDEGCTGARKERKADGVLWTPWERF